MTSLSMTDERLVNILSHVIVLLISKKEFQNRVFLFSNFLGSAILNNCDVKWDVKWLPFCYWTKALCVRTIDLEQPRHVTIIQDGGAQEI